MQSLQPKNIFQFVSKSDLIKIILIVTIVFVVLQFIRISMLLTSTNDAPFYQYLWNKLSLPSDTKTFIHQPWSLFTFYFLDGNFFGIIGNMLWLYLFGYIIEDLKGMNRVIPIFMVGGIGGGLLMLVFSALKQPIPQYFTGASCAVMAVAFAALMFKPNYKLWLLPNMGVPLWVFVLVFVALRLASIQLSNLPYLFLMLGGLLVGLLYTNLLNSFFDACTAFLKNSANWFDNRHFVKAHSSGKRRQTTQTPFKHVHLSSSKIDQLLDKINEKGMNSLSAEERKLLHEYSERQQEHES